MLTFHRLIVHGLNTHQARRGIDDDQHAAEVNATGYPCTGDDIRRFRADGFPTRYIDHSAGIRLGMTGIQAVSFALQTLVPPPHISCPSCTCGVPREARRELAATYLTEGESAAENYLREHRQKARRRALNPQTA